MERALGATSPNRMYRVAGNCVLAALATLAVASVALAIFFSDTTRFAVFGPINDVFTAITLALMMPAVVAVRRLAGVEVGGWFGALSIVTLIGLLIAIAGFLLLVARVIDLQASFVTFGVGMLPFLAWVAVVGYLALRGQLLSRALGWWIWAFLVVTGLSIVALPFLPFEVQAFTIWPLLALTLAGWMFVLGRALLREGGT